ncbi:phosphomevalonate kinase [Listeria costaricensis]|uniref:phosphomevalonate kinase n=1 Tax=Listeria costaricensis TaxID=2026604 RepID=UPI000C08CA14|nr:phosphomevalonate kinase [Listeria costaricensis]
MSKLKIKIPGKLYIAGEYAVVESGHTAILAAVDRYITLTLEDSWKNQLTIPHYEDTVTWPLGEELQAEGEHWTFTAEAINTATAYLKARKISLSPIKMTIETELIDESGFKYGLGSSAAATTAVIKAMMARFAPDTPLETQFKMAALSHLVVQGNGSCGDIASCMYGGWIAYTTFDQDWVTRHLPYKSLAWFLTNPWPNLKIEQLETPTLPFAVGWTGNPVSTGKLVSEIQVFKQEQPDDYRLFLEKTGTYVEQMLQALKEKNLPLLFSSIKQNRLALKALGEQAHVPIETELLGKLAEAAEQHGGAGKLSGSGGGDCGIAFLAEESEKLLLETEWEKLGIKSLPFHTGSTKIEK